MVKKTMTLEDLDKHIKTNSEDTYSLVVELAALYLKLYGRLPKIGLSGAQAEYAKDFQQFLPEGE